MNDIRHAMRIARRYADGGSDNQDIDPVVMPSDWDKLAPGPHGVPRLTIPRYNEAKPIPPLPESPDQKAAPVPEETFTEQRAREVGPPATPQLGTIGENLLFGMGQDITAPISEGPTVQNVAGAAMASPFMPPGAEGILGKTLAKTAEEAALDLAPHEFTNAYKTHAGTGSNPGGFFSGFSDGIDRYVKTMDEDRARNEVLANRFYEMWGVPVAHNELTMTPNGKYAVASHIIPDTQHLGDWQAMPGIEAMPHVLPTELGEHFPADAMLANWDVVGLNRDNILVDSNGKAWRIDHGGALEYRAQGKPKGAAFGSTVGELTTMREQGEAGKIFHGQGLYSVNETAQKIAATTDDQIRALVKQYGPKNITDNQLLAEKLIKRRDDLTVKYGLKGGPGTSGVSPGISQAQPQTVPVYGGGTFGLQDPPHTALMLFNKHDGDAEGIAAEMYNIAKNGHPSYVDEVYKALPHDTQVDVNAHLNDMIEQAGVDPWNIHEPEAEITTLPKELPKSAETPEDEKPKNQPPLKLMQLNKTHSSGDLVRSLSQISYDEAKDNKKLVTPKQVAKILGFMSNSSTSGLAAHMADLSAMERNNAVSWIPSHTQKADVLKAIGDLKSGNANFSAAELADYEENMHQHQLYEHEMAQGIPKEEQESTFGKKPSKQGDIKTPQGGKYIGSEFVPQYVFDSITPMDWLKYKVKNGKYLTQQDFPNADIGAVKNQGYSTLQLWHKLEGPGTEFGKYPYEWSDPLKFKHYNYSNEKAIFAVHDPEIAKGYGRNVLPFVARDGKIGVVHYPEAKFEDIEKHKKDSTGYNSTTNSRLSRAGREMGYDMLVLKGISDIGGPQTQYMVLNPSILRGPRAKFDPGMVKSMKPLSGIAGIPAAGAATYGISNQDQTQYYRGGAVKGAMRVARGYAVKTGVQ